MTSSGYAGEDEGGLITEINVTPLVDVVLVLLIVLMVTMPVIISQDLENERQMDISLPEASTAAPLITQPREVVINVDRVGRYTVRQAPHTAATLLAILRQAESDNPGRAAVLIRADKHCYWESVAKVIDLCNKAQIRQYRVAAVP